MNKSIAIFVSIMALLVLVDARPPKKVVLNKLCQGNPICEEAARTCGPKMKDAHTFMKGKTGPNNNHAENMEQCAQGLGIDLPERLQSGKLDMSFFFALDETKMMELKKCTIEKAGLIDASGLLIRSSFVESVQSAFVGDNNLLGAMVSAVYTCPEPQDFKMMDFFKCMAEACIDNITI